MGFQAASFIGGNHALVFVEGDAFTVPAPGICGELAKPGIGADVGHGLDPAWFDLGTLESADPTVAQQDHKLWAPNPGALVLKDILENMRELSWKLVSNDFGPFDVEAGFRAAERLVGGQKVFTPLSAQSRKAWMHLQVYDQDNNLAFTIDQWCRLRPKWKIDQQPTKPEWDVYMLRSRLVNGNTGAIA